MTYNPSKFDTREYLLNRVRTDSSFEREMIVLRGYTLGVDDDESPAVDGRNKMIWVREDGLNGAVHQVFNPDRIPLLVDFPCLIKHSPKEPYRWEVFSTDWDKVINFPGFDGQNFGVGTHGPNHEWPDFYPGTDVTNIFPRAIAHLRTYVNTLLTVNVWAHRYPYNGTWVEFNGYAALDMSSHQPASGLALLVLVYLDKATNSIKTLAGSSITDGVTLPPFPSIPDNAILSAFVRIDGSQTSIVETDIIDLKMTLTESQTTEVSGIQSATLHDVAFSNAELDFAHSKHIMDRSAVVRRELALIEAELDFALSTHVVG